MSLKLSTRFFWAGVLIFALGLVVLLNATLSSIAIVTVTGVIMLVGGLSQVFLGISETGGSKWLSIFLGVITMLLGWSFWGNPLSGLISLTTFLLILLLASGFAQMFFGIKKRGTVFFWPSIIAGLISIGMAIVVMSSDTATMVFLGTLLGLHMLTTGVSLLLMAMFMKQSVD